MDTHKASSLIKFTYIKRVLLCSVISFTIFSTSYAADISDKLYFNGFFTVDATTTTNDIHLISNAARVQSYQAGSFSINNSIIGAQVEYQLTDTLSFYTQAKAFINTKKEFDTYIDWAYVNVDLGDDLSLRAGQFQIPFLQGIELRNIGVSRLWARPLIPNNGAGGFTELLGIDVNKHVSNGESQWDFQFSLGKTSHNLDEVDAKGMAVLSARYQYQSFALRTALLKANYVMRTKDGALLSDSANATMLSIESEFSPSNYLINVGYSNSLADFTPDDSMAYISIAYQIDSATPYIVLLQSKQHFVAWEHPTTQQFPNNSINLPKIPDGDNKTSSISLGLRYNVTERYVFKIQLEHNKTVNNSGINNDANGEGQALSFVFEGGF